MHSGCPTLTSVSVPHMFRDNVMSVTYVLESHTQTDRSPALSAGAHGAPLWHSALSVSLGMLHYLHCAFLWPRWDMTGATGSSWIKQWLLKAQGEGRGWWGGLGETAQHRGCRLQRTCRHSLRGWREVRQGRNTQGQRKSKRDGWTVGEKIWWRQKEAAKGGWIKANGDSLSHETGTWEQKKVSLNLAGDTLIPYWWV